MKNLIRKIGIGTALIGSLIVGSANADENIIKIPYKINNPVNNWMLGLSFRETGKTVVEEYSNGYKGDLGSGSILEDATDIRINWRKGYRCIDLDFLGNFKGSSVYSGYRGMEISQDEFDESVMEADTNKDGHVSGIESVRYQNKIAKINAGKYSNCKDKKFWKRISNKKSRSNTA